MRSSIRSLRNTSVMRRRKLLADMMAKLDRQEFDPAVGEIISNSGQVLATAEEMAITIPAELVEDLHEFDGLPRPIRWLLHETITVWRAEPIVKFLAPHVHDRLGMANAIHTVLQTVVQEERREQRDFAAYYRACYGYPLPHLAAAARIQRYGAR